MPRVHLPAVTPKRKAWNKGHAIDLVKEDRVRERVSVIQSKTKRPVQFELTENTRETVQGWVKRARSCFPAASTIDRTFQPVNMAGWCTIG